MYTPADGPRPPRACVYTPGLGGGASTRVRRFVAVDGGGAARAEGGAEVPDMATLFALLGFVALALAGAILFVRWCVAMSSLANRGYGVKAPKGRLPRRF